MINKLWQAIYGSTPLEINIENSRDIALQQLNSDLNKSGIQAMVGRANEKEIIIQRGRVFFQSPFNPIFFGSIKTNDMKTVISGAFRVNRASQIFITLWFGINILFHMEIISRLISKTDNLELSFLGNFTMTIMGVGFVLLSLWSCSGDKEWIEKQIRKSAQGSSSN